MEFLTTHTEPLISCLPLYVVASPIRSWILMNIAKGAYTRLLLWRILNFPALSKTPLGYISQVSMPIGSSCRHKNSTPKDPFSIEISLFFTSVTLHTFLEIVDGK
jgi:hypothetical protein